MFTEDNNSIDSTTPTEKTTKINLLLLLKRWTKNCDIGVYCMIHVKKYKYRHIVNHIYYVAIYYVFNNVYLEKRKKKVQISTRIYWKNTL